MASDYTQMNRRECEQIIFGQHSFEFVLGETTISEMEEFRTLHFASGTEPE